MGTRTNVTAVLAELADGNTDAATKLLPLVYDELRELADRYLRDEACDHTLQPTALVHEVYLRLVGHNGRTWESRAQFFGVAAQAMRRILIDYARRRGAAKRGGDRRKLSIEQAAEPMEYRDEYLVALDDALTDLASVDPRLSRIVELRFFGGLNVDEVAVILGVSPITVKRHWKLARGWLHGAIIRSE